MFPRRYLRLLISCIALGFILSFITLVFKYGTPGKIVHGKTDSAKIKYVMDSYFKAWEEADSGKMYEYISAQDKETVSLAEYKTNFTEFPVQPLSHHIKELMINKDLAKILLSVNWPDITPGKNIPRIEVFYLQREGKNWKVRESVSLEK